MSESGPVTCSEASLGVGEPLAGTASDARYLAAVSWPKALWHRDKAALSEGLPDSLRALEPSLKASGQKLQLRLFQRAGAATTDRIELICADFARGLTSRRADLPSADCAGAIRAFVDGAAAGEALARPLLLVCTDGKHDLCCGKLGRMLLTALRADGRVDAAEVSHLGGHRLAANCLALPSGELYGRVGAGDAPALVDALLRGRVYLPGYRGRSGLDEIAQIAEAEARRRFPDAQELRIEPSAVERGARCVSVDLRVADGSRRLALRCVAREFLAIASCGDSAPEQRARWIVESTTEESC